MIWERMFIVQSDVSEAESEGIKAHQEPSTTSTEEVQVEVQPGVPQEKFSPALPLTKSSSIPHDSNPLDPSQISVVVSIPESSQVIEDNRLGGKLEPPIEPDPKPPNIPASAGYKGITEGLGAFRSISNKKKGRKQQRGTPAAPSSSDKC